MTSPLLAIVGRPNVGKSTLFNRLVGGRPALVHDTPGLTRDRRYGTCDYFGTELRIVDTGGLDPDAARWLSTTLETKRDRGAALVLSSHRLHDLAGFCDSYLFLLPHQARLVHAHEISPTSPVTAAQLAEVFDKLRGGAMSLRAVS